MAFDQIAGSAKAQETGTGQAVMHSDWSLVGQATERRDAEMQVAMLSTAMPDMSGSPAILIGDSAPPRGDTVKQVHVPRLDHFNKDLPIDHFRFVFEDKVSASARPLTCCGDKIDAEKDLLLLVQNMHPGLAALNDPGKTADERDQALRAAAKDTAIMDLRTIGDPGLKDDPKVLASNDADIRSEEAGTKALGMGYHRFEMNSHVPVKPADLAQQVGVIKSWVDEGKTVDIHCYHGTDRTGLMVTSFKATYDPHYSALIKEKGQGGVNQAYNELKTQLLDYGCDPSTHAAVFQSLHQYLEYLHDPKHTAADHVIPVQQEGILGLQKQALQQAAKQLRSPHGAELNLYSDILKGDILKFDPATHTAFYRQLDHEWNKDYIAQHTTSDSKI